MRPSTLWFNFKQGFKNIKRNWMFSLASVITMAACIFLFGIFYSIVNNVEAMTKKVETEIPITVFFVEGAKEKGILKYKAKLEQRPEVERVEYISPEQAWEETKENYFKDNPELAEGFKEALVNSANLRVYIKDIEKQSLLVEYIKTLKGVREVNQSEEAAKNLSSLNKLISYVSLAVIVILLLISVFLISNTVSVGIAVRGDEIGIMKLIGATDGFVRAPFLLEGLLLGFIGATIPLAALYFLYNTAVEFVLTKLNVLTSFIEFIPVLEIYKILLPVGLLLGLGIGGIGSFITTKKHLQV